MSYETPWRSLGDSNPCFRRERATSWAARRRERPIRNSRDGATAQGVSRRAPALPRRRPRQGLRLGKPFSLRVRRISSCRATTSSRILFNPDFTSSRTFSSA